MASLYWRGRAASAHQTLHISSLQHITIIVSSYIIYSIFFLSFPCFHFFSAFFCLCLSFYIFCKSCFLFQCWNKRPQHFASSLVNCLSWMMASLYWRGRAASAHKTLHIPLVLISREPFISRKPLKHRYVSCKEFKGGDTGNTKGVYCEVLE